MGTPTVSNIIVGGAILYYAPAGEAPPANSVALGTAWGGGWARLGLTKAPLAVKYEAEYGVANVEEHLAPVKRWKVGETAALETVLAEMTPEYFALVAEGTHSTTTTPAASQAVLGSTVLLTEYILGFEGTYVNGSGASYALRGWVHKGTLTLNGDLTFSNRNGEYPGIPVRFDALADASQAAGETLMKLVRVEGA